MSKKEKNPIKISLKGEKIALKLATTSCNIVLVEIKNFLIDFLSSIINFNMEMKKRILFSLGNNQIILI